jgi:hypothetical protein
MTQWAVGERAGVSFGAQIGAALAQQPMCILLDEVRSDEPETIAPLLNAPLSLRQIWSFRGATETQRLQASLGMLARRADTSRSEAMVRALYERLPFVVTLRRREGKIQIRSIAEWQFNDDAEYPIYTLLLEWRDGEWMRTDNQPQRELASTNL